MLHAYERHKRKLSKLRELLSNIKNHIFAKCCYVHVLHIHTFIPSSIYIVTLEWQVWQKCQFHENAIAKMKKT